MRYVCLWLLCAIHTRGELEQNETSNNPHDIRVWIYTEPNTTLPLIDLSVNETFSPTNDTYDATKTLLVIIHGFKGSGNETKYLRIKDGYLEKGNWNVILLDWSPLANVDRYSLAVSNADHVALLFTNFLNTMASQNLTSINTTHILGFSIGSQIAGIIGKHVDGKLARIIALDPAYPVYANRNTKERLHTDDAAFVNVIHTSGKFISFDDSLGHADFYPNGGRFPQPLCLDTAGEGLQLIPVMICSHTIAVEYFIESIFNEHQFMAKKCQTWIDFQNNSCSSEEVSMGYGTPSSARGDYFLVID